MYYRNTYYRVIAVSLLLNKHICRISLSDFHFEPNSVRLERQLLFLQSVCFVSAIALFACRNKYALQMSFWSACKEKQSVVIYSWLLLFSRDKRCYP